MLNKAILIIIFFFLSTYTYAQHNSTGTMPENNYFTGGLIITLSSLLVASIGALIYFYKSRNKLFKQNKFILVQKNQIEIKNQKMFDQNMELIVKQGEILYQTQILSNRNDILVQSQEIIKEQNEKLRSYSENLEKQVIERTKELHEIELKNQQMLDQNMELILKQGEVLYQTQMLSIKNEILEQAQEIIKEQNEKLLTYSGNLEIQVEERTRQLIETNFELKDRNNQLEQYGFITAHNLRGPVARVIGLANIFNKENINDEINLIILDKVQNEIKLLDEVIMDLNQILEIRRGTIDKIVPLDLQERIDYTLKHFNDEISKKNITVNLNLHTTHTVHFVKSYLDSILYNLISNAIKYSHPNRNLVICISNETYDKHFVRLLVQDNGLGIDLKQHGNKVFGLYKRFHSHIEGKGLGLHTIKTQIETLGGKIEIESEVDKGTTFLLYFKKYYSD